MATKIPNDLLALVSDEQKNKQCICVRCIALFNDDKAAFIHRFRFQAN